MKYQKMWRCDAGCPDFITISSFPPIDDKDSYAAYLTVEMYCGDFNSWWERLKAVWDMFRGRRHLWCEIALEDNNAAQEIADELLRISDGIKKARESKASKVS